jgi:hypothetical protein
VGVRSAVDGRGDRAVGSFALLALLAPVSEYGQVAIDTRAAESPGWSCTEDIFDRKHTVKVQKSSFPARQRATVEEYDAE